MTKYSHSQKNINEFRMNKKKATLHCSFGTYQKENMKYFYATNKDRIRRVKFFVISISKFQFQNFSFKISFQKFSVSKIFLFQNFFSKILVSKFSFFKISVLKSQFQNLSFKISVWKFVHKRIANDRTYTCWAYCCMFLFMKKFGKTKFE